VALELEQAEHRQVPPPLNGDTKQRIEEMDVTPVVNLIGDFTDAGQKIAPALAGLGFITSALQLLVAHVIGSPRGQELGKAGMIGSVLGLVAVFFAPQIMATVHAAFGS
jgi:hypothetical protein